jgi:hypothetical protein
VRSNRSIDVCLTALAVIALSVLPPSIASARDLQGDSPTAPRIAIPPRAIVDAVTIETYGQVKPDTVRRYLSLRSGAKLDQAAVDHDYANLVKLGGYRVRVAVAPGSSANTMTLHWIVMLPWFELTANPFYEEAPLADPTRGVGFVVTSAPLGKSGENAAFVTSQNLWAHHYFATFTAPVHVDAAAGREYDLTVSGLGEQNLFRVSFPRGMTIDNWTAGAETQYLLREANGNQFEAGLREERSTSNQPSGIVSAFVRPSSLGPARSTLAEIGISHACDRGPAGGWYPPYCHIQYRAAVYDAVGGLGATGEFQEYVADVARYIPVRTSTLALHAVAVRTGGILPESRLLCVAALRGYPDPFCGTDGSLLQVEYRIRDAAIQPLKFVVFTETGASRTRGGTQPFAPPTFQWHADSGIEIRYRGVTLDVARGSEGYRLNLALAAQAF